MPIQAEHFAVPHPSQPVVAVVGSSLVFPVRRIHCVGRNYADHVKEMGHDGRETPIFFMKPADAVVADGTSIPYPPMTRNLHHEVELVVAIGRAARHVSVERALESIYGYAVGVDLTRRDLQDEAKKGGKPWEAAKSFDHSAPIGAISRAADVGHLERGYIRLAVNGQSRQAGDISQMTWSVAEIISQLSRYVQLVPGDLIYTGTPAGVGHLVPGDQVTAEIHGLTRLHFSIGAPSA